MKRIFFIVMILAAGLCAKGQTPDEVEIVSDGDVKLEVMNHDATADETPEQIKERKKLIKEHEDMIAFAKASNSMKRGYFVLLADHVSVGRSGYRHYDINSNSNFVLCQNDDGIIQIALNSGSPGTNGLGGWTGKGTIRNKKIRYDKDGNVFMQYDLVSAKVNATVSITLYSNSNYALAQVTGGYPITIYGKILPYRDNEHR